MAQGLPGIALHLEGRFDFPGLIPQIPLVHDVEEGSEFIAALILVIHIVGNGDEVDTVLPEKDFGVKTGL
jgi:hypothetical protein